jgi:hypothetical protein
LRHCGKTQSDGEDGLLENTHERGNISEAGGGREEEKDEN